jgi:hypothetical protein
VINGVGSRADDDRSGVNDCHDSYTKMSWLTSAIGGRGSDQFVAQLSNKVFDIEVALRWSKFISVPIVSP